MTRFEYILCFGEVLWDNLPTGALPGGAPMNVALHLEKLGIRSFIASSIGNDEKGRGLLNFLEHAAMDLQLIQKHDSLPTSEVKVYLNSAGNATFEICEPVAWDDINLSDQLLGKCIDAKALVYGSLASRNESTRNTLLKLLEQDVLKIMDVNLRAPFDKRESVEPLMKKADILKLNDDEMFKIGAWYGFEGSLEEISKKFFTLLGLKILVVTRGEQGALLVAGDSVYSHPGYKVKVADTVGAGDAFLAGFLSAYFEGTDMATALDKACAIGAFVASKSGATPEYQGEDFDAFHSRLSAN
ncbi:MAG: carbohydrate kinase [Bacteroidales bacterium]|nr:carbohydrate kinase [Bacteroidales bacterium]